MVMGWTAALSPGTLRASSSTCRPRRSSGAGCLAILPGGVHCPAWTSSGPHSTGSRRWRKDQEGPAELLAAGWTDSSGPCVRSALQPRRPVTLSSTSPTTRPRSVMVKLLSVISCQLLRILATCTERPIRAPFFDVPQVDDVVEQEQESVQRADGEPVGAGFARDEQGTACRPDEPDETAHVGGETFRFAGGEGKFGQAVDDNPADRMLAEFGAQGSGQDVEVQIAHRDV